MKETFDPYKFKDANWFHSNEINCFILKDTWNNIKKTLHHTMSLHFSRTQPMIRQEPGFIRVNENLIYLPQNKSN